MEAERTIFYTSIVNSDRYKKYKWYRYTLYTLILFYYSLSIRVGTLTHLHESFIERMEIHPEIYYTVLMILVLFTLVFYLYCIQHKKSGTLHITNLGFIIGRDETFKKYLFKEINDLVIERGATYHLEHQQGNYLHSADSWIRFKKEAVKEEIEFSIDSVEQNEAFEAMLKTLKDLNVKFTFLSI